MPPKAATKKSAGPKPPTDADRVLQRAIADAAKTKKARDKQAREERAARSRARDTVDDLNRGGEDESSDAFAIREAEEEVERDEIARRQQEADNLEEERRDLEEEDTPTPRQLVTPRPRGGAFIPFNPEPLSPRIPQHRRREPSLPSYPDRPSGNTLGAAANAGFHGAAANSKEGKKARAIYAAGLQREADAAARVRHKQAVEEARRNAERDAEVAKFGAEEVERRRREELLVMRDMNVLPSDELLQLHLDEEEEEIEELAEDPLVTIRVELRVDNKSPCWNTQYTGIRRSEFSIQKFFEDDLTYEIIVQGGDELGWVNSSILALVRSHPREKWTRQSMKDFSEAEWDGVTVIASRLAKIAMAKAKKRSETPPEIEILLDIRYKADPLKVLAKKQIKDDELKAAKSVMKRPAEAIVDSTDGTSTSKRHTRTDQLKLEKEQLTPLRLKEKELVDRWQCRDERCRNFEAWCWTDKKGRHYSMDSTQMNRWAKSMTAAKVGVNVTDPPAELWDEWLFEQGPITADSKQSLKKQEREETKATINWAKRYREEEERQKEEDYERKVKEIQEARHRRAMGISDAPPSAPAYQYSASAPGPPQMPIPGPPQMPIAYPAWPQQHAHHAYQAPYAPQAPPGYQPPQVIYPSVYNPYGFQPPPPPPHNPPS